MILTAYHKWLYKIFGKSITDIAAMIYSDCLQQNPQAFKLLEETGDVQYTSDTFRKAAELVIVENIRDSGDAVSDTTGDHQGTKNDGNKD